jgi:hypothetical protein
VNEKNDRPVELNYQSPNTGGGDRASRKKRLAVGLWIGLRAFYWVIRIAVLIVVAIYARRLVRMYGQFMPK